MPRILSLILTLSLALMNSLFIKAERFLPQPLSADSITISLLTCAPGAQIYELEGHSALRIRYADIDIAANWGIFDFAAPNFVYRFVKGETDYSIGIAPTPYFISSYAADHRRVTEQVINLSQAQAAKVIDIVDTNLQPQNRVYRYNFVLDNCATRILAILNRAVAPDSITFPVPDSTLSHINRVTFRNVMRHYHQAYPWYQFGINLALGHRLDLPVDTVATAFAPQTLMHLMASARFESQGSNVVSSTFILSPGPAQGTPLPPTPFWLTPAFLASVLLIITLAIISRAFRNATLPRLFFAVIMSAYAIAGCIIFFLVFFSVHYAASPNIQLLWLNPLAFIVPALIFIPRAQRILSAWFILNILACFVALVAWAVTPQWVDSAFTPLILTSISISIYYLIFHDHRFTRKSRN